MQKITNIVRIRFMVNLIFINYLLSVLFNERDALYFEIGEKFFKNARYSNFSYKFDYLDFFRLKKMGGKNGLLMREQRKVYICV